ncbi:Fe-S cluster assembly ATPase SufC [symbiont of Argiope bruennichi]|uniref:Fe-S cluster assembly ATPase SufC n=1 Tax=symbiont of Argiope bruennichi TaxID=2810479 RepID=UPI003DA58D8E
MLKVNNLSVFTNNNSKKIINNLSINFNPSEVHVIIGPNGNGKSTFLKSLINDSSYQKEGEIIFENLNITNLSTEEITKKGIFLCWQNPLLMHAVNCLDFLQLMIESINGKKIEFYDLYQKITTGCKELNFDFNLLKKTNENFSGGERKKFEILQLYCISPKIALIDEFDSGLDIDGIKKISKYLQKIAKDKKICVILVSHYESIYRYLDPDFVHVMVNGTIVESSKDKALIEKIATYGYDWIYKKHKILKIEDDERDSLLICASNKK